MSNNRCAQELKAIAVDCPDDDEDFEVVVVDAPKPSAPPPSLKSFTKEDALSFWMGRVKHKNADNCIEIDKPSPSTSALHSKKIIAPAIKATVPIVTHQKEKERTGKGQVIDVEEEARKQNIEKYKNSLFGVEEKKPAPKNVESEQAKKRRIQKQMEIVESMNQKTAPKWVEPQWSKKRRFQKQMEIVESMNQPRWKQEKQKRQDNNRSKYYVSSVGADGYEYNLGSRGLDTYNQATWQEFQRKEHIKNQKNKEKRQQEKRKQKQMEKELKRQKKRQEEKQFQEFASGMFGIKKQKVDEKEQKSYEKTDGKNEEKAIEKADKQMVEQVPQGNAEQVNASIQPQEQGQVKDDIIQIGNDESSDFQAHDIVQMRAPRYGLKDIIRKNQSHQNSELIRAVLSHNYQNDLSLIQSKKTPDVFDEGAHAYKRIFHYLISNQCIADISQRMQKIQRDEKTNPIKVTIIRTKTNQEGQTQIHMKQASPTSQKGLLSGFRLSRLRIGLITNQVEYKKQHYGISDDSQTFGILVLLVTPESKEEMQFVKALGRFKQHDLQMVLLKKGKDAYFHDLDKLSTNFREYQAVANMQFSELAPIILDPHLMERQMGAYVSRKELLNDILQQLQNIFNQTQFQSIRQMVLRERGIVMLQGPPGTGKTSTLMGLLSAQYQYLKKTGDNRKIMICAPSNAAVDHIVKRLLTQGLFNGQGDIIFPNVLRVGIVDTLDQIVRSASLDDLCQKKMIELQKENRMTTPQIKQKLIELGGELKRCNKPGMEKQYNQLKQQEIKYQRMLYEFREQKVVTNRRSYIYVEQQYLCAAEIILTTLSSSGNQKLDQLRGQIACLIIDEAAQATEPNLLIALQTGVQKVLLIGDPYQLPATCMSSDCNVTLFNRSLFQRFLDANIKPYFLNIQYRMAPLIRHFPSRRFYQNRLIDAASVTSRACPPFLEGFANRNVAFLDVKFGRELLRGSSYMNELEGKVIGTLVKCLLCLDISMGIITPYQAQRKVISRECIQELHTLQGNGSQEITNFEKNVMINTVDSFQGQERDIIIVSTVRANNKERLGFITDERRINVTLTRSKFLMIIVGHGDTLGSNEVWNQFLQFAQKQKVYYEVNNPLEIKNVLKTLFSSHNINPVNRRRYQELSTDIRRKDRKQMYFSDARSKKANQKIANKLTDQEKQASNVGRESLVPPIAPRLAIQFNQQKQPSNKYALDIKESQKIRDEKRQKQKQVQEFQAMNNRMREQEQKLKYNKDYAFLF